MGDQAMSKIYVDEILPKENAQIAAPNLQLPSGSVIQVVEGTTNVRATNDTTSYTDTGLTASITPSSTSNKILVQVTQPVSTYRNSLYADQIKYILTDGNNNVLWNADGGGHFGIIGTPSSGLLVISWMMSLQRLFSPATTSQVTYKTRFATRHSGYSVQANSDGHTQVSSTDYKTDASIILMEIAQ